MKTVYLHIGLHKTGTTYLQEILAFNSLELLNKGYLYPKNCCKNTANNHGHYLIPWKLKGKTPEVNLSDLLLEMNQTTANNIIISSEEFEFCVREASQIKDIFSNYDVKIIVYLRRQDNYIESNYNQCVKQGSFSDSIQEFSHQRMKRKNLNYYNFCCQWASVFGEENLIVRNFETSKKNLIQDFFNILGLEDSVFVDSLKTKKSNTNVSVDVRLISTLRVLAKLKDDMDKTIYQKIRNELIKKAEKKPKPAKPLYIIPINLRKKIMTKYNESNQKLIRFIDDLSGLIFNENEFKEKQLFNVNDFFSDNAIELCSCLIKHLKKT